MENIAPIVLFVYNRPDHTRQTLEALATNTLASESELFIFSDAPKNESAVEKVQAVRSLIKTIRGFKLVTIIERDTNWGLAKSIIEGVTEIVNRYGKIIVLEDDIVTSPYFLKFMNDALRFYEQEKQVWHIAGYSYPIDKKGLPEIYFTKYMSCWGWATWSDRWKYFEKNVDKLIVSFTKDDIFRFNINGTEDFWRQVLDNKSGKINTWAIFWYATIFQNNGLCLNSAVGFAKNIGFDGTGVHCGISNQYATDISIRENINFNKIKIKENEIALERIMQFYKKQKKNLFVRAVNKSIRMLKKL
ncbi:MAG: glycosyltransferase [Dysgonamonadaceae bacterium]|jgi:hypothetical protein|nr:glycosyltransferase [Dysgonamonadaceae bacterium]